ncbi:hypothetical protein CGLO_16827 [Colletotrichum gloeosporioides Cg-14]|uniref:Uncharacterized protein n=1 Tax=Colletotrichum gloeosporioides (strain Cg-14) TaxID=1237896 RepID=T0JMS0_COLGC|nr:hypothetical protein CGLO_16827 [Colletotrichum gloeosporioides Cg-14]
MQDRRVERLKSMVARSPHGHVANKECPKKTESVAHLGKDDSE